MLCCCCCCYDSVQLAAADNVYSCCDEDVCCWGAAAATMPALRMQITKSECSFLMYCSSVSTARQLGGYKLQQHQQCTEIGMAWLTSLYECVLYIAAFTLKQNEVKASSRHELEQSVPSHFDCVVL
jgi:hypothetical protein